MDNVYSARNCKIKSIEGSKFVEYVVEGTGVVPDYISKQYENKEIKVFFKGTFDKIITRALCNNEIVSVQGLDVKEIEDECFCSPSLRSITLPETLEKIGHSNFAGTFTSFNIPAKIIDFPADNLINCKELSSVTVSEGNLAYKAIDGVLYNYDLTEIVYCPRAKEGTLVLPKSIKRIGEYCFYGCTKLTQVKIPPIVETIGDYAFSNFQIDELVIPNSVKYIGKRCFESAIVRKSLYLSNQITYFPERCFHASEIEKFSYPFHNLVSLGEWTINSIKKDIIPERVSFNSLKKVGESALRYCNETKYMEFFSQLEEIGPKVFEDCHDKLQLRMFSYCPIELDKDAFNLISKDATLIVPEGTRCIYENAVPWSLFTNIEEWNIAIDKKEKGKEEKVSDETIAKRLKSLAESKTKVDRLWMKDIISELALTYLYVDNEEDYKNAIELFNYNRSFYPAIIPDLEQKTCQEWTNYYRLKLMHKALIKSPAAPFFISQESTTAEKADMDTLNMPIGTITIEIPDLSSQGKISTFFGEDILRELQNHLCLARDKVQIAVSWFTNYALFKQIKEMSEQGVRIQLITNNDLINNGGYCLNLNELIEAGVEISLVEYPHLLHHKFCIIDDHILINGSYNWTRLSAKNYENIMIIEGDELVIADYSAEFQTLLDNAEHKCISKMPDNVPVRPEYDRSAFKQYITEELDAEARETSDERFRICALQKAVQLNPEYIETINPEAVKQYASELRVLADAETMKQNIVEMAKIADEQIAPKEQTPENVSDTHTTVSPAKTVEIKQTASKAKHVSSHSIPISAPSTKAVDAKALEKIKASGLFMVLDVSGSMEKTYKAGHVHSITKKALSASLALTESKEVSLWTFGSDANYVGNIGIANIDTVKSVSFIKGMQTNLSAFVSKASSSIQDNSLVIIFTDDDGTSIQNAIMSMKKRENVFWRIIVYGNSTKITKTISGADNVSVVNMSGYTSKTDKEISEILLNDYIQWKKRQS